MSDVRPYAMALALALLPASATLLQGGPARAADDSVTMDVLGTVSASLDGEAGEWLTIAGDLEGEEGASASWQQMSFDLPEGLDIQSQLMAAAGDQLTEEQRDQLEQMGAMFGGENPMAEMFGQMAGMPAMGGAAPITISIGGHRPDSPNILTEQLLILEITLDGGADPESLTWRALPADIHYIAENSSGFIPDVFYVSDEAARTATITFERLELEPGGGHAAGRFEASICRMEGARLMEGPDLSDCMRAEGRFDTALIEE